MAITISDMITNYMALRQQKGELNEEIKKINSELKELERDFAQHAEATGLDKFSTDVGTVSVNPTAMRAKYDPELWHDIVQWAVENDYDHIVQRRLSDAKVLELLDEGVVLPDGLEMEPYTKVSVRAK